MPKENAAPEKADALSALNEVLRALEPLTMSERRRVLNFCIDHYRPRQSAGGGEFPRTRTRRRLTPSARKGKG